MSVLANDAQTTSARTYPHHARPLWHRLVVTREFAVIALLITVFLYATLRVDNFDGPLTITYLILDIAPIMMIALPMTLIIVTGEIDLSVASVVGLTSVTFGLMYDGGSSIPTAIAVALLVGAICGAFNGFLVAYVGLPSLAVTIGTLALYRGVAVGLLGTEAVTEFPDRWTSFARSRLGESSYPTVTLLLVGMIVIFFVILHLTTFGRGIFEIGLSAEAARFSGVNVERTKFIVFTLAGLIAGLAGIYYTLRYGSARGDNATGMELQIIAAVLLGGVSIFGGRGALPGVVAAVLLIGVISSALRLENVTINVINIIIGLLLVASVVAPSLLAWLADVRHRWGQRNQGDPPPATAPSGRTKEKENS